MIRKNLTILSLIGLMLSVGLWGVSYMNIQYVPDSLDHNICLCNGAVSDRLLLALTPPQIADARASMDARASGQALPLQPGSIWDIPSTTNGLPGHIRFWSPGLRVWGFSGLKTHIIPKYDSRLPPLSTDVVLPFCYPSMLFAIALASSYIPLHRRRKRKKHGLCVKCGYDLRGSKDRCPECGQEFIRAILER